MVMVMVMVKGMGDGGGDGDGDGGITSEEPSTESIKIIYGTSSLRLRILDSVSFVQDYTSPLHYWMTVAGMEMEMGMGMGMGMGMRKAMVMVIDAIYPHANTLASSSSSPWMNCLSILRMIEPLHNITFKTDRGQ